MKRPFIRDLRLPILESFKANTLSEISTKGFRKPFKEFHIESLYRISILENLRPFIPYLLSLLKGSR